MNLTIGMPCQAFLRNYLYWKEQLPIGSDLQLDTDTEIRMVIRGLLVGKMSVATDPNASDKLPDKYNAEIVCKLPAREFHAMRLNWNIGSIRFFDTYLYRRMMEDLLYKVMLNKQHDIDEKITIETFMSAVKIDELIEFDRVKKAIYRLRKERKLPIFHLQNCPYDPNPYQLSIPATSEG